MKLKLMSFVFSSERHGDVFPGVKSWISKHLGVRCNFYRTNKVLP
jgi:hypothetical protein